MTDSILESSDDTDAKNNIAIDLEFKIHRFTKETDILKKELEQAEEKIVTLERDLKSKTKSL